jgi:uncharacterized membrane protein YciS (DUF1049 family)
MKDFFLNRQIDRIERSANNDFAQILEFGAKYYPTRELHHLLHQLDLEFYRYVYLKRVMFLIGGSTTFWVAFFFLFQSFDFKLGVFITLFLIPVSLIYFLVGSFYINQRYKPIRQSDLIEKIITEELDRRRKDASIF